MSKLTISGVEVIQGNLYEVWGEDGKLIVYDTFVQVVCDGEVYDHIHMSYGTVTDDHGYHHPNYNAMGDAEKLANRITDAGVIDTKYWHCMGNLSEMKTGLERLEESWSDNSDHFQN